MSKKLKLSHWHDGSVKPVHKGVYERQFPHAIHQTSYYTYFDGKQWAGNNDFTPSQAMKFSSVSGLQNQKWRGVLK